MFRSVRIWPARSAARLRIAAAIKNVDLSCTSSPPVGRRLPEVADSGRKAATATGTLVEDALEQGGPDKVRPPALANSWPGWRAAFSSSATVVVRLPWNGAIVSHVRASAA